MSGNGGCSLFNIRCLSLSLFLGRTPLHTLPLLHLRVSSMGALHELLECECFLWAVILHKILQPVLFTGCSLSGISCSRLGYSSRRASGPAKNLHQHGLPMGSQFTLGILICCSMETVMGCRWISSQPWTAMSCSRTVFLPMNCKDISALALGAPLPPPSSLTLVHAGLFLTPLSQLLMCSIFFSPFLKTLSHSC